MNDLLSRSFSSRGIKGPYVDLKRESMDLDAMESNTMAGAERSLAQFFEEVAAIKDDMGQVKKLLQTLQDAIAESRTVSSAQAMRSIRARMDHDIEEVLRKAKIIKARLETLDHANLASQTIPGCEPGSSCDRTRMSITHGLRQTLHSIMDEFQELRLRFMSEYRDTIQRRYFTVTGKHADESTIDDMIDTGESETFLQKAIQEQGKGHIIETLKEIQERHETVKEIEKNLIELHQIFLDMAVLVEAQGEQLNNIELAVQGASSFVRRGTQELHTAKKLQSNTRKWKCYAIIILLVVILLVAVPILIKVLPSLKKTTN